MILMATKDGERFLDEQLASINDQTFEHVDLLASDDGSRDGTKAIIEHWVDGWSRGTVAQIEGPKTGNPADNFRFLLLNAPDSCGYVAFADQDDVWQPHKLSGAIEALAACDPAVPALYCARTALIDERGQPIGFSPAFKKPPSFRNALVQSLAGGNTMVFNRAAFQLLREASRRTSYPSHDWWAYMMVTGAGGKIIYSTTPDVLYRQHGDNAVGSNLGWLARANRFWHLMHGRFRRWNDENLVALALCEDLLTDDARGVVASFKIAMRERSAFSRPGALISADIYRQTLGGQIMLLFAATFGLA